MTAISVWTDEERASAYALTDQAVCDTATGQLVGFTSKVLMLPAARLMVAVSGRAGPLDLQAAWNEVAADPEQFALLDSLPSALRLCFARRVGREPSDRIDLYVALFDMKEQRPRCFAIGTHPVANMANQQPYGFTEIEGVATPPVLASDLPDGYVSEPRRDARYAIRAQRQHPFPLLNGCSGVGGSCLLYCVSAAGITYEEILRFDDQPGEAIDRDAVGQDIVEIPKLARAAGDILDGSLAGDRISWRMDVAFAS